MLSNKKCRAKSDGIEFSLTKENVEFPSHCPVFNTQLLYGATADGNPAPNSASFDRIDPSKGYTPENTRVISNRANTIKNNATIGELELIIKYMRSQGCEG